MTLVAGMNYPLQYLDSDRSSLKQVCGHINKPLIQSDLRIVFHVLCDRNRICGIQECRTFSDSIAY